MIVRLLTEKTFGVSRLQKLVRVYTCQNVKLLEISCSGSIICLSINLKVPISKLAKGFN